MNNKNFSFYNRRAAAAAGAGGFSDDLGLNGEDEEEDTNTATATAAPMDDLATGIEYRIADLRLQAEVQGINWTEIENLGHAAVLSAVDVLKSFLAAFNDVLVEQAVLFALSTLEAAYEDIKTQTDGGSSGNGNGNAAGQRERSRPFSESLGDAPIFIMQRIIELITPQDLEDSLNFMLSNPTTHAPINFKAPGAARACYLLRFDFPLMSPKTAKLVEILQRYCPRQLVEEGKQSNTSGSKNQKISASPSNYQHHSWSGIVFAQQRTTVLSLSSLLANLPRAQSWLESSPFMAQGVSFGGSAFMPDEQRAILDAFRAGKLNLLVATSVAEEGIDVKSCQLVIRFDPAPTAQAFHQSRGRARAAGSQLIALVEHGNAEERAAVHEMAAYQYRMREAALQNVADLAQAQNLNLDELDNDEDAEDETLTSFITESNRACSVASTGSKVDLHSAVSVLHHYISQLPADEFMLLRPGWRLDYLGTSESGGSGSGGGIRGGTLPTMISGGNNYQIRATVRLPSSSPVQIATGQLASTKRIAKASAALEACRELHRLGALNDHLLPAGLEVEDADLNEEDVGDAMATVPGQKRRRIGTILGSVNIKTVPPASLSTPLPCSIQDTSSKVTLYGYGWKEKQQQHNAWFPLVLLLPKFIDLSCCSSAGGGSNTNSTANTSVPGRKASQWGDAVLLGEFQLDAAQLQLVLQCDEILKTAKGPWHSLSLVLSASSNHQENPPSSVKGCGASTYALAPLRVTSSVEEEAARTSTTPIHHQLDWALLHRIIWLSTASLSETSVLDIMQNSEEARQQQNTLLQNSVLITKYNRMMYDFLNVSGTMKLSSSFPQDTNRTTIDRNTNRKGNYVPREQLLLLHKHATFADFYSTRWNQKHLNLDQPLLKATRTSLSSTKKKQDLETLSESVYLVPELCTVHPIPLSLWPALLAAPRLLWDIEGGLHAFEFLNEIQASGFPSALCPPLQFIKQALTAPSAAIDSKEEGNYETLEALGDGLLKFAASTQLFLNNPVWHEGQLTGTKDRMVSNRKLIKVALGLHLERRVRLTGWRVKERKKRKHSSAAGGNGTNDDEEQCEDEDVVMEDVEDGEIVTDDASAAAAAAAAADNDLNDGNYEEDEMQSTKRNGKLLADAMEALIGAFFIGAGFEASLAFLRHVELADCQLEKLSTLPSILGSDGVGVGGSSKAAHVNHINRVSGLCFRVSSNFHSLVNIEQIEAALGGYKFKNPALAQEALTHGSVLGQRCYQRLEFLGDCILDLVLLKTAYTVYKGDITPAQLHDIRSITLNAERLALAAVRANLHTHINYHSAALLHQIDEFVVEAEAAVKAVVENSSSRNSLEGSREDFAWNEVMVRYAFGLEKICAPKVLSDITEALMGAVWLDSQGDWDVAAAVVMNLFSPLPWIDKAVVERGQVQIPPHPVRRIYVGSFWRGGYTVFFCLDCIKLKRIHLSINKIKSSLVFALQELAAKCGVKAEFIRDFSHGGRNSSSSVNTVSIRVMFGGQCLGQGPPSGATNTAARLAAAEVLRTMDEGLILSMFSTKN